MHGGGGGRKNAVGERICMWLSVCGIAGCLKGSFSPQAINFFSQAVDWRFSWEGKPQGKARTFKKQIENNGKASMCVSRRGDDGDGSPVDDGQSVTSNLDGLKDFKGDASRQDRHPGSRRQQEQRLGGVVTSSTWSQGPGSIRVFARTTLEGAPRYPWACALFLFAQHEHFPEALSFRISDHEINSRPCCLSPAGARGVQD